MNDMVPVNLRNTLSTRLRDLPVENELGAGIESGYGIIGYKGKTWSIRYRGETTALLRDDGDGPRNSIEVVILKSSAHKSKIFYEKGYIEGSTEAPDCFSTNGVTPDASVQNPPCSNCAACPMNVWGGRITESGGKGKRCSDSKRVAVAPVGDLKNELYGGPMLLRVPAASLAEIAQYGEKLKQMGIPSYAVATKIAFDAKESYPKFVLSALRTVTDDEIDTILELRGSEQVARILSEEPAVTSPGTPPADMAHLAPPPAKAVEVAKAEAPKEAARPTTAASAAPASKRTQKAAPAAAAGPPGDEDETSASAIDSTLDDELDALLGK